MKTRFDFEQEIMNCWSVVDDIDVVRHALLEQDADTDRIDNMLLGLAELYQVKFDIMFKTFESLVGRRELDQGLDSTDGHADVDPNLELAELSQKLRQKLRQDQQNIDPGPDIGVS